MKQLTHVITIAVLISVAIMAITSAHAQGDAESKAQELDTRIWSQSYWLKMAQLGFVEVAPKVPQKKAFYSSSRIDAPGILTKDSPDVPVTTITNTTQSENSVFVHPLDNNTVLNSNNSTDWVGGYVYTLYGADALFTKDGGTTWGGQITGAGGTNSGDPATAIGLNGRWYVGYVAATYDQGVAYSTDAGTTWTHVLAAGGGYVLDKNHLWIDNSPASSYEGDLYSAWTNFQGGSNDSEIEIVRSTNDGISWSSPINISSGVSAGSHNQGVNIQTGPNGEVYAVWTIYDSWPSDETALGLAKSTNGGASYATAARIITNIRGIRSSYTSKNMRVNSFPVMAVDISGGAYNGHIYVVWANIGVPGINTGSDIDVYMIKSTNGGSIWSSPVKVNQDPSGLGKEHFFPWINCDPETGDLHVIFYDDRNVSSSDCETFVATSTDGGATWTDFKVSDVSFTPSPIPGLASGYFGDYLGISARGGKVYPAWTDNRDGRAMTYVSPFAMEQENNPPQVIVTYPDGGETLTDSATITWTATDPDPGDSTLLLVDLDYSSNGGGSWNPIAIGETNDGAHFWNISGLSDGSNYLVRITVTDTGGLSDADTSDATFTIYHPDDPSITVNYPNGGETLATSATVTWSATDPDPGETASLFIDLDYSSNGGGAWTPIATGEANDGSYLWDISGLPDGSNYLVRATATDPTMRSDTDESDATFTIDNPEPPAVIDDLTAALAGSLIHLYWSAVTEDTSGAPIIVEYYAVYRNADPNFSPDPSDSIGATTETFYDDLTPALKDTLVNHYYIVKAVDKMGRKSEDSNTVGEFDRYLITEPPE